MSATEFDNVLASIRKHKGEQSIMPANRIPVANHIPTGNFMLDFALLGGVADGYASMLYGLESCGKSALAQKIVANAQIKHAGRRAVWVDAEQLWDSDWGSKLGVDTENLMVVRPDTGNEAVDVIEAVMGAWETSIVVLDSIPSCVPKAIIEKSAEDQTMAELARLMGVMCSKIAMSWSRERKRGHFVTVILVNQYRSRPGVMFGDPRTLPGGRQINHLPSTKIELKGKEIEGKDANGLDVTERNEHTFKLTKHKHGASITSGEAHMNHNPDSETGLAQGDWDDVPALSTYAKRLSLIHGGGSSWKIEGVDRKFGRLSEIQEFLYSNPDEALQLKQTAIAMQRTAKGLPAIPPDGYLLDWAEVG